MKRILLLALVALLAGTAYAETRDVNPTLLDMFDQSFAPFTPTPEPVVGVNLIPFYIDEGANKFATGGTDTPAMYTGATIGDLAFMVVHHGDGGTPALAGWTEVPCSDQTTGTMRLTVWYLVLESTNPTRLITGGVDHTISYTFGLKVGTFDAADPFEDACSYSVEATPTTSVSIDGFVIENPDSMVITVWGSQHDGTGSNFITSIAQTGVHSAWTEEEGTYSAPAGFTKNTGTGGGAMTLIAVAHEAGTLGTQTATSQWSEPYVGISFAVNGEQS
jgi:hypothetical protein